MSCVFQTFPTVNYHVDWIPTVDCTDQLTVAGLSKGTSQLFSLVMDWPDPDTVISHSLLREHTGERGDTQHSTVDSSTLNTQQSILNTQHSILNTLHSILNSQQSTINTHYSTLNTQYSTLNTQYSTVNTQRGSDVSPGQGEGAGVGRHP